MPLFDQAARSSREPTSPHRQRVDEGGRANHFDPLVRNLGSAHGDDIAQAGPAKPLPHPIMELGDVDAV